MILKTRLLSQRDPQWGSVKLGTSNSSMADYGCLVTALAMYVGMTPIEVNATLKDNGGYQNDLVVWSKLAVLGLNPVYASTEYTGPVTDQGISKIKEFLNNGQPLICHIDFNPSTTADEMHWLLLVGYDGDKIFANDPWTGQTIDLDVYGGAKRAIIQFKAYDKKLTEGGDINQSAYIESLEADRLKFWQERDEARKQLSEAITQLDAEKAKSKSLDEFVSKIAGELNVPNKQEEILKAISECLSYGDTASRLDKRVQELTLQGTTMAQEAEIYKKTILDTTKEKEELKVQVSETNKKLVLAEEEYKKLLSTIDTPLFRFSLLNLLVVVFKKEG